MGVATWCNQGEWVYLCGVTRVSGCGYCVHPMQVCTLLVVSCVYSGRYGSTPDQTGRVDPTYEAERICKFKGMMETWAHSSCTICKAFFS